MTGNIYMIHIYDWTIQADTSFSLLIHNHSSLKRISLFFILGKAMWLTTQFQKVRSLLGIETGGFQMAYKVDFHLELHPPVRDFTNPEKSRDWPRLCYEALLSQLYQPGMGEGKENKSVIPHHLYSYASQILGVNTDRLSSWLWWQVMGVAILAKIDMLHAHQTALSMQI